jgi:hypothetical protein
MPVSGCPDGGVNTAGVNMRRRGGPRPPFSKDVDSSAPSQHTRGCAASSIRAGFRSLEIVAFAALFAVLPALGADSGPAPDPPAGVSADW